MLKIINVGHTATKHFKFTFTKVLHQTNTYSKYSMFTKSHRCHDDMLPLEMSPNGFPRTMLPLYSIYRHMANKSLTDVARPWTAFKFTYWAAMVGKVTSFVNG